MAIVIAVLAGVLVVAALAASFVNADAARLAKGLRYAGPSLLGIAGLALLALGRVATGGTMIAAALGWAVFSGRRRFAADAPRKSMVRTAALEMELNHETGGLEGIVLAGRHDGKELRKLSRPALTDLYLELVDDPESRRLLEPYLDGRFPAWRKDAKPNGRDRKRVAPGAGAMTEQEAYQILGLETGATATAVRQAHRRLIERLNPRPGDTSVLAARINEAKDVLLSNHR